MVKLVSFQENNIDCLNVYSALPAINLQQKTPDGLILGLLFATMY